MSVLTFFFGIMKIKSNLLVLLFLSLTAILFAQTQMPNSDFEQWTSTSAGNAIPKYWHSYADGDCQLKGIYSWGCGPMLKNHSNRTTGYSGYGCEIYATSLAGNLVNGVITTGQMQFASTDNKSADNYSYTDKDNKVGHNAAMKFTGRPDSVYFWCKFDMKKPSNVAVAKFHLHTNVSYRDLSIHSASTPQKGKIANAFCDIKDQNDKKWHCYKYKFTYYDEQNKVVSSSSRTPSYILVSFSTNKITKGGNNGDKLTIDNIVMIYNKRLSYLKINGEDLPDFNPDILIYDFYCNTGDDFSISAAAQSPHATVKIENPSLTNMRVAKITVIHDDGEQEYFVRFHDDSELQAKK